MNEETVLRFIRQIIVNSDTGLQGVLALKEMEGILSKQNCPETYLELIRKAMTGLESHEATVKREITSSAMLSAEALEKAVIRAHEEKIRQEEMARNGRC